MSWTTIGGVSDEQVDAVAVEARLCPICHKEVGYDRDSFWCETELRRPAVALLPRRGPTGRQLARPAHRRRPLRRRRRLQRRPVRVARWRALAVAARGGGEPPSPDPPPEIEPIVLAVLEARVKEAKAAARATIEHLYAEGTRSPLEANLDNAEYVDGIAGTNEQAIAVLAEHALELLARIEHVKASTVNAAVVAAARAQEPLPGIERFKARGSLVGRPDRNAGQAAEWLVQAGVMPWDGRPFCSGQAADESKLRGYKPRPCERSAAA